MRLNWLILGFGTLAVGAAGCGQAGPAVERNDLAAMRVERIVAKGHQLDVWVAETDAQRKFGLMRFSADEVSADRGMLFVFPDVKVRGFWMKNTLIPLDIAFIRSDGVVINTHTMPAGTLRQFTSDAPARYALELSAGRLAEMALGKGDRIELPASVK